MVQSQTITIPIHYSSALGLSASTSHRWSLPLTIASSSPRLLLPPAYLRPVTSAYPRLLLPPASISPRLLLPIACPGSLLPIASSTRYSLRSVTSAYSFRRCIPSSSYLIVRGFCTHYDFNFDHKIFEPKDRPNLLSNTPRIPTPPLVSSTLLKSPILLPAHFMSPISPTNFLSGLTKGSKTTARFCTEKKTSDTVPLCDSSDDDTVPLCDLSYDDTETSMDLQANKIKPSLFKEIDANLVDTILLRLSKKTQKSSKRFLYIQNVCRLLEENKKVLEESKKDLSFNRDIILKNLQISIEKSTVLFDEESIYKTSADLFDKLTSNPITLEKRSSNLRNILVEKIKDDYIIKVLNRLDVYTLEVLVIYALGQIFNDFEMKSPSSSSFGPLPGNETTVVPAAFGCRSGVTTNEWILSIGEVLALRNSLQYSVSVRFHSLNYD